MEELLHKILEKEAVIGILGLGYTGLSLAHDFGNEGFKTIGYDIDSTKIEMLLKRESYLPFLPLENLFCLLDEKIFIPTNQVEDLKQADVIIVSVPTPLSVQREPDISYLKKASEMIARFMHKNLLVVVQSTTFPGTTEEEVLPILEKGSELKVGNDFFLAYVPEREDAGNPQAVLTKIPRICGGITRKCMFIAKTLYEHITVKVHPCSSTKIAEAAKTYENTFRLINIAFVDEMKIAFDRMGINIWEVIEASSTKPFGFTPFYPGPGIGGECIPVDPLYLAWRAKQFDAPTTMIESASTINIQTSEYVVQKVADALSLHKKKLEHARVLVLGVAFKKDVSDIRESPSIRILHSLQQRGADISYHDFYVPQIANPKLASISLIESIVEEADCVVILTDHSEYNWPWICEHSQLIVDTRNATQQIDRRLKKKIIL